jgi:hypothetical protein
MNKRFKLRDLGGKLLQCVADERGTAMTEYLLITGIMVPLAAFLFYPDNGFYLGVRNQYDLTTLLLKFPGP